MNAPRTNKIIWLLVAFVIAAAIAIYLKSAKGGNPSLVEGAPPAITRQPDADSPADTLRTVSEQLKEVKAEQAEAKLERDKVKNQQSATEDTINRIVEEKLKAKLPSNTAANMAMQAEINDLKSRLQQGAPAPAATVPGEGSASTFAGASSVPGIPAGLGFDKLPFMPGATGTAAPPPPVPAYGASSAPRSMVWVEPINERNIKDPVSGATRTVSGLAALTDSMALTTSPAGGPPTLPTGSFDARPAAALTVNSNQDRVPGDNEPRRPRYAAGGGRDESGATRFEQLFDDKGKAQTIPYFTIPENSTLTGTSLLTALIGRIPINGRVSDPYPFKAIIGKRNLAASGFDVPDDVAGAVIAGTVVGDWALACAIGTVGSITFIFNDGSVKTISQRADAVQGLPGVSGGSGVSNAGLGSGKALGYLSDEFGTPCLPGQRLTNAPVYLGSKSFLKGLEIAAQGAAAAQTTTQSNALGGFNSAVTGNQDKYVLGKFGVGAAQEVNDWFTQRLNNSFDAVFVPPGQRVVVHIDQSIQLDKSPSDRKLNYGRVNSASKGVSRALLD